MIHLKQNTNNIARFTFRENMKCKDNWVLLEIRNETNPHNVERIILKDNLSNTIRYDEYLIVTVDKDDKDINNAWLNLPLIGFHTYKAFEIIKNQVYNENIKIVGLIEQGRLLLESEDIIKRKEKPTDTFNTDSDVYIMDI